tara:strand:- start:1918 stop:2925 length:1008 start_codon:yes stop_codon:yes gene_type:complete
MAGAGLKTWSTGDVLTASDVNTYLMEQSIMVFATATARDAAITSPSDGMFAYTTTTPADTLSYYNGAAWVAVDLAGDITGITTAANSSLSGGATSGTVTLTVDVNNTTSVTAVAADYVLIADTSDSNATKRALISDITALVPQGDLTGLTAGTNIDITSATGPVPTITLGIDAAVDVGTDGTGVDVSFHSGTAGDLMLWDASDKALEFTDAKISMADNLIEKPEFIDYAETINVIGGTGGGTQDIDISAGNVVTATVDTSTNTFTFSNPSVTGKGCSFTLILTNGGSQTVAWPASVDWAGGTAPTLTAAGNDILTFMTIDAGTRWYGFLAGAAMA